MCRIITKYQLYIIDNTKEHDINNYSSWMKLVEESYFLWKIKFKMKKYKLNKNEIFYIWKEYLQLDGTVLGGDYLK